MTQFLLRRPVLSVVCSIIILLAGLVCIPTLPIAQYPEIAPPVVTVTAVYTGASPLAVESQVTTPLENAINGVQGLRYISSSSAQGVSTITCTFVLGTNLDIAAADVQNNVQSSIGLLPQTVQQVGITVAKNSGAFVMAIALTSDSAKYDTLFLSNYAQLNVVNDLSRIPGVSQILIFGQRQYAMRIWLNPRELAARGLDTGDVVGALQQQNVEVAAGSVGAAPQTADQPYTYPVNAVTQLSDPSEFSNIILRADPNGGFTRLSDVARVELGAQNYSSALRFDGDGKVIGLGVLQYSTANALALSKAVTQKLDDLSAHFPPGVHYKVAFNSTTFVQESIREVVITLLLSIVLVVLVIFLFLQDPRSTLIPAATIPVSLIGTFFIMKLFGFTINTITLFGLTLATGLVVDDAIVVIENIARHMDMDRGKATAIESADTAMREIQSAVVASSLVLLAVFVPVAFFPGTTGQLYKQFALTIAASITISLFQALSLAPTLSARLLRGDVESTVPFFMAFNKGLGRFRNFYARTLPTLFRRRGLVMLIFLGALLLTGYLFRSTPSAFIPDEDQGYFIALVQAPEGTSLAGTVAIAKKAEDIILHTPGVRDLFDVGGFSFSGAAPNRGIMFAQLTPWGTRPSVDAILQQINFKMFTQLPQAQIFALNPPAINGVGSFGGFQFEIQDRGNVGLDKLMQTTFGVMGAAAQDHRLANVFTQFRLNSPQLNADIDRNKALAIGVPLTDVFQTMQVNLGSLFVNNFTYLNRSWQVIVQADEPYRNRVSSLGGLFVRSTNTPPPTANTNTFTSSTGSVMTPLSALVDTQVVKTAPVITHYNLYRSIELSGASAPGHGSGEAIDAMQQIAKQVFPPGISYEWSGIQLDEIAAGSTSLLIFALGIVVVFLVLSAQYENYADPLIVLFAVPAALLGALLFLNFRRLLPVPFLFEPSMAQDAYAQVGYVMLIGLASKSAILIVEFANQQMRAGASIVEAAMRAAQTRLRPILMTSIAFIIAVLPLVFASGAGSAARHSLGTIVFGGMLLSTFVNLGITPVLFVVVKSITTRGRRTPSAPQLQVDRQDKTPEKAPGF